MSISAPLSARKPPHLTTPLAIALATSLVSVSGTSLIYPILPVIGADLGIPEGQIGLVIAAYTLPAIVLAPLFGLFADLYGRRPLLVLGLAIIAGGGTAAASATTFEWLLFWRAIQGIGMSALSPLTIVLISDLCTEREHELQAQGWKVALDRISMIALPLIGGALAVASWRLAFLPFVAILPVAVLAYVLMPETRPRGRVDFISYFSNVGRALRQKQISFPFAIGFFRFFLDYGFYIYLPLFLSLRYQASVLVSGGMLAIAAAGAIVTAVSVRHMSRVASAEHLLAAAFFISAIGLLIIVAHPPLWAIAIGTFIVGLGNGLISPLQKSLITRNAPAELRGGVIAVDRLVQQVAKSVAPSVLGLMLGVAPMEMVFVVLISVSVAGAAAALLAQFLFQPR